MRGTAEKRTEGNGMEAKAAMIAAALGVGGQEVVGVTPREVALGVFAAGYRAGFRFEGRKTLLLGETEAAEGIAALLREAGAEVRVAVRTRNGDLPADPFGGGVQYLVDATCPEGAEDVYPAPDLDAFPTLEGVLDLTVLPLRTRLLLAAEEKDLLSCGGLYMAVSSCAVHAGAGRGVPLGADKIEAAYRRLLLGYANLGVTGLRGDGAEPVAKALSRLTRRPIVRVPNREEGLAILGEATGKLLLMEEGLAENPRALYPAARNSRLIFLSRPLDEVRETGDAAVGALARYRALLPAYAAFCDRTYEYRGDPLATAEAIYADFRREPYLRRN